MRYHEIINEAPIGDMEFHGDMETKGTFRDDDLRKMRDPKWQVRVKRIFERSPHLINLYFVNGNAEGKITQHGGSWIDRFKAVDAADMRKYVGIHTPVWAKQILRKLPETHASSVNVMLFNNEGSDRVGLTPWIVAHRIGHCFFESNERRENAFLREAGANLLRTLNRLVSQLGELFEQNGMIQPDIGGQDRISEIIKHISGFRTARTGNLRDSGEYGVELMAQYLTSGKVTFLRPVVGGVARSTLPAMSEKEAALFQLVRKAQRQFIGDERTPAWAAESLFGHLKGNPLRPRTKAALEKILTKWQDEGRMTKALSANLTDRADRFLDDAEGQINDLFDDCIKHVTGQFIVL